MKSVALTEEVECLLDFLGGGSLVDADVTDAAQEREVDDAVLILLVVVHQLYQLRIVIASDRQCAIVVLDELHRLSHLLGRETGLHGTEVELTHQSERHCVAMQDRVALQCPTLKGVTEGMSEVECLADAMLVRVFLYDTLPHLHAVSHHLL